MGLQRTSPPSSDGGYDPHAFDGRPRCAGDATADFLEQLRDGDDSELYGDADVEEAEAEKSALTRMREVSTGREPTSLAVPAVGLPPVLQRLFGTDMEEELMAVAKLLDARRQRKLTLVFHTPIGDVKCPVNWSSTPPDQVHKCDTLLLILVRSSDSMFIPTPGARLQVSFAEHSHSSRLSVMCLAPPMKLYPGVGIDLLCFLPDVSSVEKNGKLKEGAPSVVSGTPSDAVDAAGEPVVEGEKSASVKVLSTDHYEDFDQPREG